MAMSTCVVVRIVVRIERSETRNHKIKKRRPREAQNEMSTGPTISKIEE